MNPALEAPENGAGDRIVSWWRRRGPIVMTIAALGLGVAAAGMRLVAQGDSDLPPLAEFARDARNLYLPWLQGEWHLGSSIWRDHDAGRRAWDLAWLHWNGQVNAQVLSLAGLATALLALVALFRTFARQLRAGPLACLAAAVAAICAMPAFGELQLISAPGWSGCLVALSLFHLALMRPGDSWRWRHLAGVACGAATIAGATEGLAAPVAVIIGHSIAVFVDRVNWRTIVRPLAANVALIVIGSILVVTRADTAGDVPLFEILRRMAWPFSHPAWTLVLWAPTVFCLARSRRGETHDTALRSLALVGLWALLQTLACSLLDAPTSSLVSATGVIVNAACLVGVVSGNRSGGRRSTVAVALWCIAVGNALLHPHSFRDAVALTRPTEKPVTSALQQAIRKNDTSALRDELGWGEARIREIQHLFADARIRAILPPSIRPPLTLAPANEDGPPAFQDEAAPSIPGNAGVPAIGTWSPDARATRGEFVSLPLETRFPLLQFRVIGELREPSTALLLRDADGRESRGYGQPFTSNHRWKRIHIMVSRAPFQVIVRDDSETAWLAFTMPLEIGRLSWLAAKVARGWLWVLTGCIVAAIGAGIGLARGPPIPTRDTEAPRWSWKLAPWLALIAYAAYFFHHIDTTAGPNDSGGYLNSAKLLASGHITGTPHAPLAPITSAEDLDPYLPVVFRATADARMAPQYPVGFPMLIAALTPAMSVDDAVASVLLLHLIAGIFLVHLLARSFGLERGWSWLAAGLVGLSPEYYFHGLQPMSDTIALVWVTAAVYLAWTSGGKPWRAVAAGLATSIAVLIRPSNLLCVVPLILCFAGSWRAMFLWVLGGFPGAIWQFWYNLTLYGSGIRTGYGAMDTMLSLSFLAPNLRYYALALAIPFTPVVCLAFAAPFLRSIEARARAVLTSWAIIFPAFYVFYWCNGMRFLLPAAPAVLVLALLVAKRILARFQFDLFSIRPRPKQLLAAAAVLLPLFAWQVANGFRQRPLFWLHANREHAVVAGWVREHLPADAVVIARAATGTLMYYTELTFVRADFDREPGLPPTLVEPIVQSGRPVYAVLYGDEGRRMVGPAPDADGNRSAGSWERVTTLWNDGVSVWALKRGTD